MRDLARFIGAFWEGFDAARARAQPALAGNPFAGLSEDEIKAAISAAMRAAHDAGAQAERTRIAEILKLPGAHRHPRLAASLALAGSISAEQATQVLAVAEFDGLTLSSHLESDGQVLH